MELVDTTPSMLHTNRFGPPPKASKTLEACSPLPGIRMRYASRGMAQVREYFVHAVSLAKFLTSLYVLQHYRGVRVAVLWCRSKHIHSTPI